MTFAITIKFYDNNCQSLYSVDFYDIDAHEKRYTELMEFVYHPLGKRKLLANKLEVDFYFEEHDEIKNLYKLWKERRLKELTGVRIVITKDDWRRVKNNMQAEEELEKK